MLNPFIIGPPIDDLAKLVGRREQLDTLRQFISRRTNCVLSGPEGSGKSSLRKCVFTPDYCKLLAQQGVLVCCREFPTKVTGDKTYGHFTDMISSAVRSLKPYGRGEDMEQIREELKEIEAVDEKSRFCQYLDIIQMYGYRMIFVLENFERFTSSPDIQPEHHDLLCGLINDEKLQLIVATDYDFNNTSLPAGTRNSTLLSRIGPNRVELTPLTREECRTLLDRTLEEGGSEFRFTDGQVEILEKLSGGIPLLLISAAKAAFDVLNDEECGNWTETVEDAAFGEMKIFLTRWCQIMPREQLDLLASLSQKGENLAEEALTAASALKKRGILQSAYYLDRNGRRRPTDGFLYNSRLLERFCQDPDCMAAAARNNPFRQKEELPAPVEEVRPYGIPAFGEQNSGPVTINNFYNCQVENVQHKQELHVSPGFERLFGFLDNPQAMMARLTGVVSGDQLPAPAPMDEERLEQCAQEVTREYIPEELETKEPEELRSEMEILHDRFLEARSKLGLDEVLNSDLLAIMSDKGQMYLKIAVLVDDALSGILGFFKGKMGDLSPQLVMYGKVLEQHLRDNFYPLLHTDMRLMYIDCFTKQVEPDSKRTFAAMRLTDTSIGNYRAMLDSQSSLMASICESRRVQYGQEQADGRWWRELAFDIKTAGDLRNFTDHAGSEVYLHNLVQMRDLLFGKGEILHRCKIGWELTEKPNRKEPAVQEPKPIRQEKPAEPAVQDAKNDPGRLRGTVREMLVEKKTNKGGLRGKIIGTKFEANISKQALKDRGQGVASFVGRTVPVKVGDFDDNPLAMSYRVEFSE